MINAKMRNYDYFTYGEPNEYGQRVLSAEPQGAIKISISNINISLADSIQYKNATYIGLTLAPIDDSYVIQYGDKRLKVHYVNPDGRFKQVFLGEV